MESTAIAHANIALVKYWGKRDYRLNLPAVGSISMSLQELYTKTHILFDSNLDKDHLIIGHEAAAENQRVRVSKFLDLVRSISGIGYFAMVKTENNFPTGAGLASSASGFAALAVAACAALNLNLSGKELSILARQGSGSAARSIFGGFVEMKKGIEPDGSDCFAEKIAEANQWDLHMLIAITSEKEKSVGSTEGMKISEKTSPYYQNWIASSDEDIRACREAILKKDFSLLSEVAERSCLKMHALAMSSQPALIYWNDITLKLIHLIRGMRKNGIPVFFTIDAGPQVKAVCEADYVEHVRKNIVEIESVKKVIHTTIGQDARVI